MVETLQRFRTSYNNFVDKVPHNTGLKIESNLTEYIAVATQWVGMYKLLDIHLCKGGCNMIQKFNQRFIIQKA